MRAKIKKYLLENEEVPTTTIYEHINSTMKWGATMQQLGNVLAKDPDILQAGMVSKIAMTAGTYEMMTWSINPEYRERHEGLTQDQLVSNIITWLDEEGPGQYTAKEIRKAMGGHHDFSSYVFKLLVDNAPQWLAVHGKSNRTRSHVIYEVLPRSS
jgi:hypothetical protein